jgi:hypothetical protein
MHPMRLLEPCMSYMHHTGPYGSCVSHMGGGCHDMRAASTAWGLHGSWDCMGAMGTIWEPDVAIWDADGAIWDTDGAIWEPHALCGDHVGAMCTILEPCVPCGSHVGVRWCHMGGKWHHTRAAWLPNGGHMGVVCAIWEPCVPYGSWMEPYGRCMLPYRSYMHPMGPCEP